MLIFFENRVSMTKNDGQSSHPESSSTTPSASPNFASDLHISEKQGFEFASMSSSGMAGNFIATQGFAMLFLVPAMVYMTLQKVAGMSTLSSGIIAGAIMAVVLIFGLRILIRINGGGNRVHNTPFKSSTDTRYRLRTVIPPKKQTHTLVRWALGKPDDEFEDLDDESLRPMVGGFEPVILRMWFGFARSKAYWAWSMTFGLLIGIAILSVLAQMAGGWKAMWSSSGWFGYALTGTIIVSGAAIGEWIWPIYVRIVPGRIDIFRYGFLGSGHPQVESIDLRTHGLCVDFGTYCVAIEPEREIGTPLPDLVRAKRWPHGQVLPDDYKPVYLCFALLPDRTAHCQRMIQAARTHEDPPALPMDQLIG